MPVACIAPNRTWEAEYTLWQDHVNNPPTSAGYAGIFAKTVSGTVRPFAMDEDGNVYDLTLGGATTGNDNEVLTDDGAGGYTSESNLTFDGTQLGLEAAGGGIRGAVKSGTNVAGDTTYFDVSQATGNATPGSLTFRTTEAGASGSASQTLLDTVTITNHQLGVGTTLPITGRFEASDLDAVTVQVDVGNFTGNWGNIRFWNNNGPDAMRFTITNTNRIANFPVFASIISGDAFNSFGFSTDGTLLWGSGSATFDVTLYRQDVDTLRTDGTLRVDGKLSVGGTTGPTNNLHVHEDGNFTTSIKCENSTDGTASVSRIEIESDVTRQFLTSHATARTATRFGVTIGGWSELLTTAGNGYLIGSLNNTPIIFGTNNTERMRIDGDEMVHVTVGASDAVECLKLEQLDVSEGFCNYVSTVAGTTVNPLTTITHAPRAGFKRVEVNGGDQWEPFYGTPVAATAYTQTYATTSATHAARTAAALTDSTGGTANTTVAAVSGSGDDATINDNFADLIAMLENLRQDQINTAQVLNQVIDDQQTIGNAA